MAKANTKGKTTIKKQEDGQIVQEIIHAPPQNQVSISSELTGIDVNLISAQTDIADLTELATTVFDWTLRNTPTKVPLGVG